MWTRDSQYRLAPLCDRTSSQKGHIFQETSTNYSIIKTEKKKKNQNGNSNHFIPEAPLLRRTTPLGRWLIREDRTLFLSVRVHVLLEVWAASMPLLCHPQRSTQRQDILCLPTVLQCQSNTQGL